MVATVELASGEAQPGARFRHLLGCPAWCAATGGADSHFRTPRKNFPPQRRHYSFKGRAQSVWFAALRLDF